MKKKSVFFLTLVFILFLSLVVSAGDEPMYRAVLIGNGNYHKGENLIGPINDLKKMNYLFENLYMENGDQLDEINIFRDLTGSRMLLEIRESFKDNKESDISYIYYGGHGAYDKDLGKSYLVGVDGYALYVDQLEKTLSDIPGKFIILLDSCNSGGFIDKRTRSIDDHVYSTDLYNQSIIDSFTSMRPRSYLTQDKYRVITAAAENQDAYELNYKDGWGWGGEFSKSLLEALGYDGRLRADSNNDGDVDFNELVFYSSNKVKHSNVQHYPHRDDLIIISRRNSINSKELLDYNKFYKDKKYYSTDKLLTVEFNKPIDYRTINNESIFILDSYNRKLELDIQLSKNKKELYIKPRGRYLENNTYKLYINENLLDLDKKPLRKKIYFDFLTF